MRIGESMHMPSTGGTMPLRGHGLHLARRIYSKIVQDCSGGSQCELTKALLPPRAQLLADPVAAIMPHEHAYAGSLAARPSCRWNRLCICIDQA